MKKHSLGNVIINGIDLITVLTNHTFNVGLSCNQDHLYILVRLPSTHIQHGGFLGKIDCWKF